MNLVPAVRLGAVDDGAQIAAGEALDILHHLLQRAQAGTDQDVHHRCQQQGRDHTGQEQHVAHGDAFLEALVEPAAGGHRPSPGRRRGGHDDLFPRRAGRIDKGIAEDAVLLGQHLAQHRLGLLGNIEFTDLLVLELRVHDEFADPLLVGRTHDVGVAGLARDERAELLANALEFVFEGNAHRIGQHRLAFTLLQELDGAEIVFSAANGQALVILPGQQRLGHRVAIGQGHAIHRLAVLVLEQGGQAVHLVVVDHQESRIAAGQLAEGLEQAILAIQHLVAQLDDRQVDIARPDQAGARFELAAHVFAEELRFVLAANLDRLVGRIQHAGHQPGLVLEIRLGALDGGAFGLLLHDQDEHGEDDDKSAYRRHNQLLGYRASRETGKHTCPLTFVVVVFEIYHIAPLPGTMRTSRAPP